MDVTKSMFKSKVVQMSKVKLYKAAGTEGCLINIIWEYAVAQSLRAVVCGGTGSCPWFFIWPLFLLQPLSSERAFVCYLWGKQLSIVSSESN